MAKNEKISKEQLMIPIYLNEKTVLDMLAIIEDGFTAVSEVSNSIQSGSETTGKISGGFSTKAILDKLLKIQLDAGVEKSSSKDNQQLVKSEKVHTNVSLLSKFRSSLIDNELLGCRHNQEIDINSIESGDFVEVAGELRKNPMIELLEKYLDFMKMSEIFNDDPPLGQKSNAKDKVTKVRKETKQIKAFLEELKVSGTVDFIIKNNNTTTVISAQEQYLSNENISEMYGGHFKVLGKVIKVCNDETSSINLLRKNTLGILDDKSLSEMLGVFKSDELSAFNLPEVQFKIEAPAMIVIPIAVYS
ncbi:DUF6414 family protein [Acetobacterium malicum]|uniref:DUF6414 family protein n=1 Tax=Acetobacterium malicum TaxID=52692 RepID=UPI0003FE1E36|nr:hypothetical protein [Acetobacterium dehalogenans]